MNTNNLNRHLENKATKDVTEIVNEILDIFEKYNKKYNLEHESFYLLKINKNDRNCKEEIVYEDKLFKINNMRDMLRTMLKDRYFNRILKRRTEDLLNKVELLD
tara:strand:+ start:745 stop:1056 length:312 start_codon:yes stop_codon:yes gene_type:complete